MLNFLLLMLVPIAIALASILLFKKKVTLSEFGVQLGVPALCLLCGLSFAYCQSVTDTEIWNGRITSKTSLKVSCEHSYRCNCYTTCSTSNKVTSCTEHCSTCYEHSYDVSWRVAASTGETLDISRIDRQGLKMPPRWGISYIGEPFSSEHTYTNYILANPESVLLGGKGDGAHWAPILPSYPNLFDYYRTNHYLNQGVPGQDAAAWEWLMDEINGDLGPRKQVQVLLLLVPTSDARYLLALKDKWVGGKKNDAVVVIGSEDGHKIAFVDVLSWSPNAKFKILMRDQIGQKTLDQRDDIANIIRAVTDTYFVRMHMSDYEYLVRAYQPSAAAMWWLFMIGTVGSLGLAAFTICNEIVDDDGRDYR